MSPGVAMLLLASLIGSYFNIPIAVLPISTNFEKSGAGAGRIRQGDRIFRHAI
jgi:hypothetical protein